LSPNKACFATRQPSGHPVIVLVLLSLLATFTPGGFVQTWAYAAALMAALPPALNVFVLARRYDTWVAYASSRCCSARSSRS